MSSAESSSRSSRLTAAFSVVTITAAAAFAILVAGGSGTLEQSTVRLLYDAPAVVVIAVWLVLSAWRPTWLPASRLLPAILAVLGVFAVTTVTSRSPRLSVEMLAYAALLAGLYLLLVALMRQRHVRDALGPVALGLCLLVCLLYLLQVLQAWQAWWGAVGHVALPPMRPAYLGLTLGSPNPIATLVLLLAAFGLAATISRGPVPAVVVGPVVVLALLVTVISGSRGAWMGSVAGLVACAVMGLVARPDLRMRGRAFARSRRGVMLGAAVLLLVGLTAIFAAHSGRLTFGDDGYREAFWAASLRMFRSSPLVGVGPGVWQLLRASYETATEPDLYIPHAHDIYLQTLAEFGLLGVMAGALVVLLLGSLLLDSMRSSDAQRRRVGFAALFGVVLLAGQQVVDMLMNVPALLVAIALPLAWIDATSQSVTSCAGDGCALPGNGRPGSRRLLALGGAALAALILVGLLRVESIAGTSEQVASLADAGHWARALAPARAAAAADPAVTSYEFVLGVVAANTGDLALASAALTTSATADDYTYAWLDLAAVRWQMGDIAGTRSALTRAERLGWQRAPLALAAGWLRLKTGDVDAAVADDAAALVAAPTLAADPYWRSSAALHDLWPRILADARAQVARSPGSASDHAVSLFALDVISGNRAAVPGDEAAMTPTDRNLAQLVMPAWDGVPGAEARLQARAELHPLQPGPVSWCQLIAARHGEVALVERYRVWIGQGLPSAPPVDRITFGRPQPLPGGLDRYGSLYRRVVPADQVAAALPQIAYVDQF